MAGSKLFKNNNLIGNGINDPNSDALGKVMNSINGIDNFNIEINRQVNQGGGSPPPPMNKMHPVINDYLNSKVSEPPKNGDMRDN